jgi:hypothetical protein
VTAEPGAAPAATARAVARPSWFRWGPLPAAAAGLLIGLCTASTVFANVMPSFIRSWALLRDSFESGPAPLNTGVPIKTGCWSGDHAEITGAQQGVIPADGTRMFRYLRADFAGKTTADSYIGDLYQLIDLRPYRQEIVDGGAVVQLSAAFNAFAFPADEVYDCAATIYALDAQTATDGSLNFGDAPNTEALAMANNSHLKLDRLPQTWQMLTAELRLPPNSEFILIRLGVGHGKAVQRRATFDGHFVDDVRVTLARRAPIP